MDFFRTDTDWKALQYFNLYRIFIASFFIVLVLSQNVPGPIGENNPELFQRLSFAYLIFSIIFSYLSYTRLLPHQLNVIITVITDILILSFMMFISGGLASGFGLLMVIAVASGSILSTRKIAIFIAAVATIAVLGFQFYSVFFGTISLGTNTQSAILGLAFFITSFAGNYLSSKLRASEALAERRAIDLQNLAKLNEQIIDRMQSGIIAIDQNHIIQMMNRSAMQLLNYSKEVQGQSLSDLGDELMRLVNDWHSNKSIGSSLLTLDNDMELRFGLAEIKNTQQPENNIVLIFLDDASKMRQQAQSLKLESLGRLAASIAHEIRNPLGAISHAGQLLVESTDLSKSDSRLTEIIQTQSQRVNNIIENVMSISRRQIPNIETVQLKLWLERYKVEFSDHYDLADSDVIILCDQDDLIIQMDTTQLHQVLWNLSQNAIRYSLRTPKLTLVAGVHDGNERPFLDVKDTGPGIDPTEAQQLFEPFYTTEKAGTGLGLYISRELCEINQANLLIHSNSNQGCCFRILFSHPDRQHHLSEGIE